jgi:hypothetical protein
LKAFLARLFDYVRAAIGGGAALAPEPAARQAVPPHRPATFRSAGHA